MERDGPWTMHSMNSHMDWMDGHVVYDAYVWYMLYNHRHFSSSKRQKRR